VVTLFLLPHPPFVKSFFCFVRIRTFLFTLFYCLFLYFLRPIVAFWCMKWQCVIQNLLANKTSSSRQGAHRETRECIRTPAQGLCRLGKSTRTTIGFRGSLSLNGGFSHDPQVFTLWYPHTPNLWEGLASRSFFPFDR